MRVKGENFLRSCLLEKCKPVNIAKENKSSNTLMIFNYITG